MEAYRVNIQGLSNNIHRFDYAFGDEFFGQYGAETVAAGAINASVTLDKHETFIEANFTLSGAIKLVCDRSLEEFDFPIAVDRKIIFKFGHEPAEVSDEIVVIGYNTESLELGQFMYEFITLAVPMKKLHPRFRKEDEEHDEIIYTSEPKEDKDETDPRWDKLKNLNKNK
ncbi:MAG: DUF177 domain-containing protein [Cyclobacteriaceae bacterium]|nr:DUF177 domain-containing protein [Cyclobacteriaceae bacterium]